MTSLITNLGKFGTFLNLPGISSGKYGKIRVWCIFMQKGLAIPKNLLWTHGNEYKGCYGLFLLKMAGKSEGFKI